ncbi:hypothetical protein tinsulaeT_11510 [Thalassotalea insulae]|uniref:YcxB-like protein domain-containing protein n=1 Tax=Thalassotalea insulae TaxID=2056778 RepID=A0ABQ6GUH0_9GAMM|nr:YcxB family protein [Thalassotalea insulae]GLX77811.1 hypothetical protein tinsulaeT_11510 [Thalassotalea insulae]
MTPAFHYSTRYLLNKAYFSECYEQSVTQDYSWRAYAKALFFCLFGGVLVIFTPLNPYVAWFIFVLGLVEALSVYYQKPWWLVRQMLGKTANNEITLTIDDKGIQSRSFYGQQQLLWQDINGLIQTELGWIITHQAGKNYISASVLSAEAIDYLQQQAQQLSN